MGIDKDFNGLPQEQAVEVPQARAPNAETTPQEVSPEEQSKLSDLFEQGTTLADKVAEGQGTDGDRKELSRIMREYDAQAAKLNKGVGALSTYVADAWRELPQQPIAEAPEKESRENDGAKEEKEKAAKEKKRQELEKTIQEKKKEYDDRKLSVIEIKSKLRKAEAEIAACDKAIEQAELAMEWLREQVGFNSATNDLTRAIRERLEQSEERRRQVSSIKPPRKLFGLLEDKARKEELGKEVGAIATKVDNLKRAQETFARYRGEGDVGRLTDEQFMGLLQQEMGQSSEFESYKYQRDRLNEIAKKLGGRYGTPGKNEKDLLAEKQAQENRKKEIEYKKRELGDYIDHTEKEDLPKREKEIEELRQKAAIK